MRESKNENVREMRQRVTKSYELVKCAFWINWGSGKKLAEFYKKEVASQQYLLAIILRIRTFRFYRSVHNYLLILWIAGFFF